MINNKCDNCGGELVYDPVSKELKCKQCSTIVDIPEQNANCEKKVLNLSNGIEKNKVKYTQIKCKTCGNSHIVLLENDITTCPSCGDNNFEKTLGVNYQPDGIIPFSIDEKKAIKCFSEWIKHKKFIPNKLKNFTKNQNLQGLYLPIYNFDFDCNTYYSGIGVKIYRDNNGDEHTTRTPFNDYRNDIYKNYIESATSSISTYNLKKISNFDFKNIYVYRTEFLYGFIAKTIDIPLLNCFKQIEKTVSLEIKNNIEFSLHYNRLENFSCSTTFLNKKYNYLYIPIWTSFYLYKKKRYKYYINGSTGKVFGKTPKSPLKIIGLIFGILLGIGGVLAIYFFM